MGDCQYTYLSWWTKALVFVSFFCVLFVGISCQSSSAEADRREVDTLNHQAYLWRYKNLDSSFHYARQAEQQALACGYGLTRALLNQAYVYYFRMNFTEVESLVLQIYAHCSNQIELLDADVLMMRVCQRTSRNQMFYTYRNRALDRINRINEEFDDLSESERTQATHTIVGYHLSAAYYYYNMELMSQASEELAKIREEDIEDDVPLHLRYMYLVGYTGSNLGVESREILLRKFDVLFKAFATSRYYGYTYLEAYASWSMSLIFINTYYRKILREERPGWYDYLYTQFMGWYDPADSDDGRLAILLAEKALNSFRDYGYQYMVVTVYQTLGFFYIVNKNYEQAEECLHAAMDQINKYHQPYFEQLHIPPLQMYTPGTTSPEDQRWLLDEDKYTVPEWIAKEREHLSVLYTVLGNSEAVAYNRNTYLDILEVIRQDREMESKYKELEGQTRSLNALLMFVLLFVPIFLVAFFVFFRLWTLRSRRQTEALRHTLDFCDSFANPEAVRQELVEGSKWNKFEDKIVQQVFHAFSLWAQNVLDKLKNLDEEFQLIRDEQFMSEHRIAQNKRKNISKRAKVNLIYSVFPLIDRLLNEIQKYRKEGDSGSKRLEYAVELTDRINLYNEILAQWIIMSRGELSLHIENFALQDLLQVLKKNQYTFQRKGVELQVADTELWVKADKALTLFMMNTLMDNARKFTDRGGKVSVEVGEGDQYVEIAVRDTGEGMSAEDVKTILENKVYDSSRIGNNHQDSRKGHGFGLMNCKGIIEKYRKTNPIFQVCLFQIESELGHGSRFYFRLPKGIKRAFLLLLLLLPLGTIRAASTAVANERQGARGIQNLSVCIDPEIQKATAWADSLYFANNEHAYEKAMLFSDSAFACINRFYKRRYPKSKERLYSYKPEFISVPLEVKWCQQRIPMDYALLLGLRNETAIAAMNLHDWGRYYYNNRVYTQLYKILGQDTSLAEYCSMLEVSQNNIKTSIVLLIFASFVAMVGFYILYFRKRIVFQLNMQQITEVNKALFDRFQDVHQEEMPEKMQEMLDLLWHGFNEIHQVRGVRLLLLRDDQSELIRITSGEVPDVFLVDELMERVVHTLEPLERVSGLCAYPLYVRPDEGSYKAIGSVLLNVDKTSLQDSDMLLDNFIIRCFSIILYQKVILVSREYENIEMARDERDRVRYEEDALYVQNQILDNCLSSIKHESMYYPSRIRQVLQKLQTTDDPAERQAMAANLDELIVFYRSIYTTLFQQAKRQLNAIIFRRRDFKASELLTQAAQLFTKMCAKRRIDARMEILDDPCEIRGDEEMLLFLLENLFRAALDRKEQLPGTVFLLILQSEGDFARFSLEDPRDIYTQEELEELFMPEGGGIPYLICKQIIREHDTYMNFCGCRINAEKTTDGARIWFTIPKKN